MAVEWITFHLTDRCELNCDHCLRDPGLKPVDLPLELLESVLDQAKALYRTKHVGLTGGEPTLHPDFGKVIDAVVDRGMTWHMVTNAHHFDHAMQLLEARRERLDGLTEINFSLDGASEETHDSVRGAGSFRKVMCAAALCHMRRVPFLLQMAVNARNAHQVEEMAMLASKLGASSQAFALTQPTGTFLDRSLRLSLPQAKAIRDQILRLIPLLSIRILITDSFPRKEPFFMCGPLSNEVLYVDQMGRLIYCCQHAGTPSLGDGDEHLGDLNQVSLGEAHSRMLDRSHTLAKARLASIREAGLSDWDSSPCNWCLKAHGRPHWTSTGEGGPSAKRPRWRGAWAPGRAPVIDDRG